MADRAGLNTPRGTTVYTYDLGGSIQSDEEFLDLIILMSTAQPAVSISGLVYILLSMIVIIAGQAAAMHAGLTMKFAAVRGTSTEDLRARMRRRQTVAGIVMLVGIAAMFALCYRYNYWLGDSRHFRRPHVMHRLRPHDGFRELAAHLTAVPAWLFVVVTGGTITLCGAGTGYGLRRMRVHMRPPFDFASFLKAMKWAVVIALAIVPLVYVVVFGLMWLTAAIGQDVIEDPPLWLMPGMAAYLCAFAGPPAFFTLHGSRRTWRWWQRRLW